MYLDPKGKIRKFINLADRFSPTPTPTTTTNLIVLNPESLGSTELSMLAIRRPKLYQYGVLDALGRSPTHPLRKPTGELRLSSSASPRHCLPSVAKARTRGQARYATSSDNKPPPDQEPFRMEPLGQVMRRAMRLNNIFKGQTLRQMFRDSPEETSLAVFLYGLLAPPWILRAY